MEGYPVKKYNNNNCVHDGSTMYSKRESNGSSVITPDARKNNHQILFKTCVAKKRLNKPMASGGRCIQFTIASG